MEQQRLQVHRLAVLGEDVTGRVEELDKEIKLRQEEFLKPGNSEK